MSRSEVPPDGHELGAIRGVSDKLPKATYRAVIEAVPGARRPRDEMPSLPKRRRPALDIDGAVDLMVALARLRARQHGVAMPLLASRTDLERIATGEREGSPLLEGGGRRCWGTSFSNCSTGASR